MRSIQFAIYLFIFNLMLAFVSTFGLFADTTLVSNQDTAGLTSTALSNVYSTISGLKLTDAIMATVVFGFLAYVFKPMIAIIFSVTFLVNYMVYTAMRNIIPSELAIILTAVVLLFVIIDIITHVSKGGTETGG